MRPHISWSGSQPPLERDAYLLAMVLRVYSSGLNTLDRDPLAEPSVLTTTNLHIVALMVAYYQARMLEAGVRNSEGMLKLIKSPVNDSVSAWIRGNQDAIRNAERELLAYTDQPGRRGFTAFG